MTARRPQSRSLVLLLIATLCAFDAWAGWRWHAGREELAAAERQAAESERIAERIEALRAAPVLVEDKVRSSDALAQLVESAARRSNLELERIVHISPGSPRRIADTAYQEQATEVELREVTLRQVVEFALAVGSDAPGLSVPQLTLRVPTGEENTGNAGETWNVQLILTSSIYSPKITPSP